MNATAAHVTTTHRIPDARRIARCEANLAEEIAAGDRGVSCEVDHAANGTTSIVHRTHADRIARRQSLLADARRGQPCMWCECGAPCEVSL